MSHVLSDRWLALSANQLNPRFEQHYFAVKAKVFFPRSGIVAAVSFVGNPTAFAVASRVTRLRSSSV